MAGLSTYWNCSPLGGLVRGGLSRANQLHKMTSTQERPDKAPQSHGNAAHFVRIGFGDHRNPQAGQLPQN